MTEDTTQEPQDTQDTQEATPEAKPAQAKKAKKIGNRMTPEEVYEEYPHAVRGSLHFDREANKQAVTIVCTEEGCSNEREVYTSDLWQVRRCDSCTRKARRARARARRKEKREQAEAEEE